MEIQVVLKLKVKVKKDYTTSHFPAIFIST